MAVEAFESAGTVISAEAVAALDREIVRTERGAATAQCTSIACTGAIYLGKARLEPESIEWMERARAAIDEDGTVDLTVMGEYSKQMKNTTSNMLERALNSDSAIEQWYLRTADLLDTMGLPKATHRLHRVVHQCRAQAHGDGSLFRAYLRGYFFVDFLGRGMPSVVAQASALIVLGDPKRGKPGPR